MATHAEEGLKGNKKGVPVWTFVKNASLAITIFLFFFTIVLVLDAYKFVSVRVSCIEFEWLIAALQLKEEFDVTTTNCISSYALKYNHLYPYPGY